MPLVKLIFLHSRIISRKRSTIRQKQLWNDVLHVKTRQSAKNNITCSLILQKMEISPKSDIYAFLHKILQFLKVAST